MIDQLGRTFEAARPAVVVVQGDTNSASAGAQAAHYLGIDVLHVEAGLRSHDRTMPEEINRRIIGVLADVHCAPTEGAAAHLRAEGVEPHRIHLTGNTAVEAVQRFAARPRGQEGRAEGARAVLRRVRPRDRAPAREHRRSGTAQADPRRTGGARAAGAAADPPADESAGTAVRTGRSAGRTLRRRAGRPRHLPRAGARGTPAGLRLRRRQEECTVLKRPLVIVRNNTERPEAVHSGFAVLAAPGPDIGFRARALLDDPGLAARLAATPSPFGDGRAGDRIVGLIRTLVERAVPSTRRVSDRPAVAAPGVRPASLPSPVGAPTGPHPPGGSPCTDHPMPAEPRPEAFSPPPEAATTSTSSC